MKEPFEIVFDDDYLIVVNKIAKVLIQASKKEAKHTLTSLLQQRVGSKVFPCHRLDRETTGLVVYARSPEIQRKITDQFRSREIKKKYIAFVKGNLKKRKGVWEGKIIDREGKIFAEKSKYAKTFYRVLKDFPNWSILELSPVTGRTNQLRIQLAKIDHPILGEDKYAFRRDFKVKFKRLGLHAFYLNFIHPISKQKINLELNLPKDMQEFLNSF
ncbi:MAG: RluA family pseudouridine synthase [Candidatus Omnitrophica bacterium]|nr:RluA family pseudouridine synthase [Candidatus Omnitrophota bacterium]